MNVQYKGYVIFSANRDGNGTKFFIEGITDTFDSLQHAQVVIDYAQVDWTAELAAAAQA